MDLSDIRRLLAYTQAIWPSFSLPADAEKGSLIAEAWLDVLSPHDFVSCFAAIRNLAREGREFPPNPGTLFAWVMERVDWATASEAQIAAKDWSRATPHEEAQLRWRYHNLSTGEQLSP